MDRILEKRFARALRELHVKCFTSNAPLQEIMENEETLDCIHFHMKCIEVNVAQVYILFKFSSRFLGK